MFSKILIANRGEIAVRVNRTLRELGIASVAVHSDADADGMHVRGADEAVLIGTAPVADSYLRGDRIIQAALDTGAEAIHPGYGLLAENPQFARACAEAGLVFIGPDPASMEMMSSKIDARAAMLAAGAPVVPGTTDPVESLDQARAIAADIGFPVAVKAASGGGGKGFRIAQDESELEDALRGAADEGRRFFGDGTVYLERYLVDPRHVEVQVIGDHHGNIVHLYERDCSIQRRHQKLIEEAPSPRLSPELREQIGRIAVDAARAAQYWSLGTVEGLLVGDEFFFLEMNTRVQVEHPVTEMVTGLDLIEEQLHVAAGDPLRFGQQDVTVTGHAIECRLNAENAAKNFRPAPGSLTTFDIAEGEHVRVDAGLGSGDVIHPFYDPMIAKVIAWAPTREEATARMLATLDRATIDGVSSLLPFHRAILRTQQWKDAETCRDLIGDRAWLRETDSWS